MYINIRFLSWLCSIGLTLFICVRSWREWDYSTTWSDTPSSVESRIFQWTEAWNQLLINGSTSPLEGVPRPRRGHSMVLIKTQENSVYKGDTYIVMFGGRDNDGKYLHVPKTYAVETIDGTLEFTTYDDKPVNPCDDIEGKYYTAAERTGCSNSSSSLLIDIGIIYNDVWAYKLCPILNSTNSSIPSRFDDGPCEGSGWVLWHPGARQGGCTIELGNEVCTVPSERYNHGSVIFSDGTMYVYGGYSQRCADYCDDLWLYDIYLQGWRQVYGAGALTRLYSETYSNVIGAVLYTDYEVPRDNSSSMHAGPGKRWRQGMVLGPIYYNADQVQVQDMYIFGGHRLWQGFSPENSQYNYWRNYSTREMGGYLNDFWIYTKQLDFKTVPGESFKSSNGKWQYVHETQQCFPNPGIEWSTRNNISCITVWPTQRAGHGIAYDSIRNLLWIFGGYSTYFPYVSTDGAGSGNGIEAIGTGGFIPYPGYEYFKNDLWFYNFTDTLWYEVPIPFGAAIPDARVDMVLLHVEDILFMHGGFSDSFYYDDTWYFNISAGRWLEKKRFVYPEYPANCTDDIEYISSNNCTELLFPKHLERSDVNISQILSFIDQPFYWPDAVNGPYWPIEAKDFNLLKNYFEILVNNTGVLAQGTPLFPYAATGPRQYVKPFKFPFNATYNATVYQYCTSVYGEPTRGKVLDGLNGRASQRVLIKQPRRQRPGWDGCRDRKTNETNLINELQYQRPLPRSSHRAVYNPELNEIIMYGGIGYLGVRPVNYTVTWSTSVKNDMWYYNIHNCINNCSSRGSCYYGFCFCEVGYYGEDCSNTSCPGTFCDYNPFSHEQSCFHACQAGYKHTDMDVYVQDIAKLPCSSDNPGESNGICDGFGTAQCAPPFIGDDCSTKDCINNCSFNGWCSVEYPVSRCMCIPGYFGESCQFSQCLNNCSYPNGVCNTTTGDCKCRLTYSPYNNTRPFFAWGGEDCSYLMGYAAGFSIFQNHSSIRDLIASSFFTAFVIGIAAAFSMIFT